MNLQLIGLIVGWAIAATGGVAGLSAWWTGRSQARKFDAEALTMSFRAGVDSAEVLSRSAAGHVATADVLLDRVLAQLTSANSKLDAQELTIASLRDQISALTSRLAEAGFVT